MLYNYACIVPRYICYGYLMMCWVGSCRSRYVMYRIPHLYTRKIYMGGDL